MISIKLVDFIFDIENNYSYIERYCKDYIVDSDRQHDRYCIKVSLEEIANENTIEGKEPPEYLELLAVYRKICEILIDHDIFLFHCSALAMDGQAVLFSAVSGTGKSTHARLWREVYGDRVQMINDDKPLIALREVDGVTEAYCYGTPWCGKHDIQNNINAKIKVIYLLCRGIENKVEDIDKSYVYAELLNQSYRPRNAEKMRKTLALVGKLIDSVKVKKLYCNMDTQAAITAYENAFEK